MIGGKVRTLPPPPDYSEILRRSLVDVRIYQAGQGLLVQVFSPNGAGKFQEVHVKDLNEMAEQIVAAVVAQRMEA